MQPQIYRFLVEERQRTLLREADSARLAALAGQVSKGRAHDQSGRTGLRLAIVRRLVARRAAA
jgi:hypothetical protein